MAVGPKPDLLYYENGEMEFDAWKRDTLVWCAETMQDAVARLERALAEQHLGGMLTISPGRRIPWWRRWF